MTDHDRPADRWRTELRRRLVLARKGRDACSTNALRSALSAIDNAETPDGPVPSAGAIADSAVGLGSAEVMRRELADDEVRALIRGEIDERRGAADQFAATGHAERAAALVAEAAVLEGILGGV
ncbi:GatB/YqeY [Mycobacterium sp. ITM-2017-0098]|nr:GatB/YqeY [Mycobacterium sp. ITM-2017-0098]